MAEYVIELENTVKLDNQLRKFLTPKYIFIPIRDLKNSKLLVKDNSYVYKNDLVVDGREKHFSSISGKVLGVQEMIFSDGIFTSLVIENDFTESIKHRKGVRKRITDYSKLDGIRTLTKFGFNFDKINYKSKTLVINTLDLEPFFGNNTFILSKNPTEIVMATNAIGKFLNFTDIYFLMDNKESELVKKYQEVIIKYPNIKLELFDNHYPLANAELIKEKLRLRSAAILNTRQLYDIHYILKRNKPRSETLVTITGEAVRTPNIVLVKKYSLLSEVFLQNNDFTYQLVDVFLNGLLSGKKVDTLRYVIDNNIDGIIINKKVNNIVSNCTNCNLCSKYCPRKIDPRVVMLQNGNVDEFVKERCIDCGLCNHICPANIDLRKYVKMNN